MLNKYFKDKINGSKGEGQDETNMKDIKQNTQDKWNIKQVLIKSHASMDTLDELGKKEHTLTDKGEKKTPAKYNSKGSLKEAAISTETQKSGMYIKTEIQDKLKSKRSVDKPSQRFVNGGSMRRKNKEKVNSSWKNKIKKTKIYFYSDLESYSSIRGS